MSWRADSPVELPDGRLVCKSHGLVICAICTIDYSFMEGLPRDSKAPRGKKRPEGVIGYLGPKVNITEDMFAACEEFIPPRSSDTPEDLFENGEQPLGVSASGEQLYGIPCPRFVRTTRRSQALIYTDGSCLNNGKIDPPPAASCAFIFRPDEPEGTVSFRLEEVGPACKPASQTSNRAELRAVIAALQFRQWGGEGWSEIVIATDSAYVTLGATRWITGWLRNGWKTSQRTPVENQDLWETLLERVQQLARAQQVQVLFWQIPRHLNRRADVAARSAAAKPCVAAWHKQSGILV